MLLGFKKRFVPLVEDGSKTHTIRAKRKLRPRAGETCHCYTGLRQKGARLLGRWKCVKVEEIKIYECGGGRFSVWIGDQELTPDEKDALAWRDGFRSRGVAGAFGEMVEYWTRLHPKAGPIAFEGDLIHWEYVVARRKAA